MFNFGTTKIKLRPKYPNLWYIVKHDITSPSSSTQKLDNEHQFTSSVQYKIHFDT